MKKIISLLLAVLMAFSFVTVTFAADETVSDETTTTAPADGETSEGEGTEGEEGATDFGEFQWILDLPFWTVKPALKFAKIAIKLVAVYLKVAKIFGLVEQDMGDMIMSAIFDLIAKNEAAPEEVPSEPVAEESTTLAA